MFSYRVFWVYTLDLCARRPLLFRSKIIENLRLQRLIETADIGQPVSINSSDNGVAEEEDFAAWEGVDA